MDLELIGSYFMIIFVTLAGLTGTIICITILKKNAKAEMVPARIIGINSRGTIEKHFKYAVQIDNDKEIELERLERISMIGYISDSLVIKEYLPKKEIYIPQENKKPLPPRKKRAKVYSSSIKPIRSIEIDPTKIDRIYVKKSS